MEWHDRIGRRLRLRDLHTLVTVARRGSMAKAAVELSVTQPAVTRMIADMEHTLGVRLLDRKPQGVEPTPFGRALLKWGDGVFEDLRHAVRELQSLADPTAGEVWVGSTTVIVEGLLPAVVDSFSRRYPNVVFHVTIAPNTAQQFDDLRARKLDLIIGRIPKGIAKDDLHAEILFDEPQHVVAGAGSRWLGRRRIKLAELVDEPWVLPRPEYVAGAMVAEMFKASGLDVPRRGAFCSSLEFTRALVATGRYLGLFPKSFLHYCNNLPAIKVLPVELPLGWPPVGIVTLKNRTIPPAARLFIDFARSAAKPLAKG